MDVVFLQLGLHSRHLKANSKSFMCKIKKIKNYRGSQYISSYSADTVIGVTALNLHPAKGFTEFTCQYDCGKM